MPTSVKLQENFIYGIIPVLILLVVLVVSMLIWLAKRRKAKKAEEPKVEDIPQVKPLPGPVKQKYVSRIKRMEEQIDKGEMSVREGYQQLSAIIREFVLEFEGIDVTSKTLAELRAYDMPELVSLIEMIYEPEFSYRTGRDDGSSGDDKSSFGMKRNYTKYDCKDAISRTIRVIELWK